MTFTTSRRSSLRFLIAIATVGVALLVSWLLWPLIRSSPFLFFFAAVALSAWFGGLVAGLVTTVLSVIVVDYYLLEPLYKMFDSPGDVLRLLFFAGLAVLVSWLNETRQQTEDELRRSRDQLRIILEGVADGIAVQDTNGKTIFANEAAAGLIGFPSVEALLQTPAHVMQRLFEIYDMDGNSIPNSDLPGRIALHRGKSGEMTVRLYRQDTGAERWITFKAAPVFNEKKQVVLAVNILRDMTEAVQQEKRLRNQRERFEVTLNSIGDGVVTTDITGHIDFINPVAAALSGWSQDEAVGCYFRDVFKLVDHETREQIDDPVEALLHDRTISSHNSYVALIARDGTERPVHVTGAPIHSDKGTVAGAVLVVRDVTQQRAARRIREESARRLRDVIDGLGAFVGLMTSDGVLIEVNRPALEAANLKTIDVIGKPFDQTYWWCYDEAVQQKMRDAIAEAASGTRVRYDVDAQIADGKLITIDFILSPIFDQEGRVTHLVPSGIDITQRKQAEIEREMLTEAIEMQRQRLRNIVANVPGVVWEARGEPDAAGQQINFVSDYVETMLGYTVEEWLNTPNFWLTIVHPEDRERAAAESRAIFDGGQGGVTQYRCITADGHTIPVETHSTVICDETGKPIGMRGVTMDISERKRAEEALAEYARELARSNQELQQFAYVASHDLQEPLRMVSSYLQLIEQRYRDQLDEDATTFISFAVDGAARMKELINDLLDYSRVESRGKSFELTDCQQVLERTLNHLRGQIEASGAIITHDPMPEIMADEYQLVQLFQNLIGNAIKFRGDRTPEIHIGAERQNSDWRFCVRDNGIGIDPAYLDRIFLLFQRLHTIDEYEGTGIGLAICKKVVERHGGRIWVESEAGKGATFFFTIPVKPRQRRP